MTATEDIRDIFSILHDGGISAWTGDKNLLTLTVECQYLAERIDKSFDRFYVELTNVDELFLSTWPNPFDLPVQTLTEPSDIFKAELELLSADIKDGKVNIACSQHDTDFDYCGGNLTISCETIKVFDQNKNELTIDQFDLICKSYWDDMHKQHEKLINDRKKIKSAYNTGFASGGVTCKFEALCFYSSVVLVDSFVLRNPPERKARNRYRSGYKDKIHQNDT